MQHQDKSSLSFHFILPGTQWITIAERMDPVSTGKQSSSMSLLNTLHFLLTSSQRIPSLPSSGVCVCFFFANSLSSTQTYSECSVLCALLVRHACMIIIRFCCRGKREENINILRCFLYLSLSLSVCPSIWSNTFLAMKPLTHDWPCHFSGLPCWSAARRAVSTEEHDASSLSCLRSNYGPLLSRIDGVRDERVQTQKTSRENKTRKKERSCQCVHIRSCIEKIRHLEREMKERNKKSDSLFLSLLARWLVRWRHF